MPSFNRLLFPFTEITGFDKLILDYIADDPYLSQFYPFSDDQEGIKKAIHLYKNPRLNRQNLKESLIRQYAKSGIAEIPELVNENINSLLYAKTFTVTAGHQLNILGGPLYIIYKLISAINLAEKLNKLIPSNHFVPVYWMASEDHDIEEISSVNFFGKKFKWENSWKGISGKMPLDNLEKVIQEITQTFGNSDYAEEISTLISKSYLTSSNLSDATRKWVNNLLGKYGLIIIDAN